MLEVHDRSPSFSLPSDAGKTVSLRDFAGKMLVVYFYPRDSTPGCTREAQGFTSHLAAFRKAGAEVVGISRDSVSSHCAFRDKYGLKVPLLSDPDLSVHKAFGAYGEKVLYGKKTVGVIRSTFLVGKDGKIARVWRSVKVDGHPEAVLATITGASAPAKAAPAKAAPAKAAPEKAAPKKAAKRSAKKRP